MNNNQIIALASCVTVLAELVVELASEPEPEQRQVPAPPRAKESAQTLSEKADNVMHKLASVGMAQKVESNKDVVI